MLPCSAMMELLKALDKVIFDPVINQMSIFVEF